MRTRFRARFGKARRAFRNLGNERKRRRKTSRLWRKKFLESTPLADRMLLMPDQYIRRWYATLSPCFRKIWSELCPSETSPRILYHYTTGENLLKIIEKGEFWATQVSCLNDTQECLHFCNRIAKAMETRKSTRNAGVIPVHIFQSLSQRFSPKFAAPLLPDSQIFVACFSEGSDDLSQWRAYSGGGEGYAIGIEAIKAVNFQRDSLRVVRALYEPEEQENVVNQILDAVEACVSEHNIFRLDPFKEADFNRPTSPEELASGPEIAAASSALFRAVAEFAPCFKDAAYEAERERRLIYFSDGRDGHRLRFSQRRGLLAQHMAIFGSGNDADCLPLEAVLSDVVIGPCAYRDISLRSVYALLDANGYHRVTVNNSKIAFRSV